eukprot:768262-Hanusia_phi.AAC.3
MQIHPLDGDGEEKGPDKHEVRVAEVALSNALPVHDAKDRVQDQGKHRRDPYRNGSSHPQRCQAQSDSCGGGDLWMLIVEMG